MVTAFQKLMFYEQVVGRLYCAHHALFHTSNIGYHPRRSKSDG
jgi:hypothetical protein